MGALRALGPFPARHAQPAVKPSEVQVEDEASIEAQRRGSEIRASGLGPRGHVGGGEPCETRKREQKRQKRQEKTPEGDRLGNLMRCRIAASVAGWPKRGLGTENWDEKKKERIKVLGRAPTDLR